MADRSKYFNTNELQADDEMSPRPASISAEDGCPASLKRDDDEKGNEEAALRISSKLGVEDGANKEDVDNLVRQFAGQKRGTA